MLSLSEGTGTETTHMVLIVKSIFFGMLAILLGGFLFLIPTFIIGVVPELIAGKFLDEQSLKKFRHVLAMLGLGVIVGMFHALLVIYFLLNSLTLSITFAFYVAIVMDVQFYNNYYNLCNYDKDQFSKLSRLSRITAFVSYIISFYGLQAVLTKYWM